MGQILGQLALAGVLLGGAAPELVVSAGHGGEPSHATFAGRYLATAQWSNVALIDLVSGLTVARLPQGSMVLALAASPSGKTLAVGTCGHAVQLWDLEARRLVRRIELPQECAGTLSYSPDGSYLATGAQGCPSGGGLQVWEATSGKLHRELAQGQRIRHVVFAGDGRWLAGVDDKGRATVFEWPSGRQLRSFQGLGQPGYSGSRAIASPDGRYLAWLGNGLRVLDVVSGDEVPLPGARLVQVQDMPPEGPARSWTERVVSATAAEFLDDGRLAYVDRDQMLLRRLPAGPQQAVALLKPDVTWFGDIGMTERHEWLSIRRDGSLLAGTRESRTVLWDARAGQLRELTSPSLALPESLCWTPLGIVAWAGLGSGIQGWDDRSGQPAELGREAGDGWNLAFRPDGSRLAVASLSSLVVLDMDRHRVIARREIDDGAETGIAFSPDGSLLAFGTEAEGFGLFDDHLRPRRSLAALERYSSAEHVAFSADGRWVAAGMAGRHPAFRVWPVAGAVGAATLDTSDVTYGPQPPAFSSDSRWLASFRQGNSLVIWATASWKVARSWGLEGTGRALAFAPRGSRLAVASDHEAAVWDAETGRKVMTFSSPGLGETRAIAWSPDGQRVVSAADDGVLRFWRVSDGRLLASLYVMESDGDWLLVAPDGRLDGSDAALRGIVAWRFGDRVVSNWAMTRRHHVPGLWRSVSLERP
jgi:WD40 repeat protein